MQISNIKLTTLQAMLSFVSSDETHYVLNGVLIDCHEGGVRLVATDGRRMLIHDSDWKRDDYADASFIIPAEALRAIAPENYDTDEDGEYKACGPRYGHEVKIDYNAETHAITVALGFNGLTFSCKAIDGNYPNWKSIPPNPLPEAFPAKRMALNGHFFADLMQTLDAIDGRDNGVAFSAAEDREGTLGPLIAKTKRTTALLMPLRNL